MNLISSEPSSVLILFFLLAGFASDVYFPLLKFLPLASRGSAILVLLNSVTAPLPPGFRKIVCSVTHHFITNHLQTSWLKTRNVTVFFLSLEVDWLDLVVLT